ncbi:hypothetical protein Tco_1429628 [Tanacetum coccineum]
MNKSDIQKNLYNTLIESYNSNKDLFASYGDVERGRKEESSKEASQKESKSTSSSKGASKSQPKSSGKSAQAEEHGPRIDDLEEPLNQEFNTRNDDVSPVREIIVIDERPWNPSGSQTPDLELECHLEEVFKATNDQLDWHNPERRPYPHDLSKPLPLIQNTRGRQVIPFDHFINNDLEYLKGGSLIVYDKHAYWGTYHWGPKRLRFYGYATNMETLKDVYSRHRIIAVTSLKIMEFFGYKHLEEITVQRQTISCTGKLTNLNLDERFALNVALRMYTRRIVIQEHMEDLQLAVESYQKKINLSRLDSYHRNCLMRTDELHKFSDGTLNHVHTTLNNIATGIQMEYLPKYRRLMRSLENFVGGRPYGGDLRLLQRTISFHHMMFSSLSDGTLNDVRTALNDHLKGIRMKCLPQTIWRQSDRDKARAMIQAIDKQLKTRRIMRSLEKFVEHAEFDESNANVLERFYTSAGNPIKEILLKLNLPDHKSILTDSKVTPTNHGRMTKPYSPPRFIANCFNVGYLKMDMEVPGSS